MRPENKKEDKDDDTLMFLAFSVPCHKCSKGSPKLAEIGVCLFLWH